MALRIAVCVKAVPDAAGPGRILPASGRIDRSGESTPNPYDLHAIECAVRLGEGGTVEVEEIVAVTMGPPGAVRVLHNAMSRGADRAIHLTGEALAGSDVLASGYALAAVLAPEAPDLVLLGQQSADGEAYTLGAVLGEYLGVPSVSQVVALEVEAGELRLRRQAEYGYDTLAVPFPAVVSVSDTINEPRYPSLKAIMTAKRRPLLTLSPEDAGIDPARVGAGSRVRCGDFHAPAVRSGGTVIEGADTEATVARIVAWLEERGLL